LGRVPVAESTRDESTRDESTRDESTRDESTRDAALHPAPRQRARGNAREARTEMAGRTGGSGTQAAQVAHRRPKGPGGPAQVAHKRPGDLAELRCVEALCSQHSPILEQEGQAEGTVHTMHVIPHKVSAHRQGQQQPPARLHHLPPVCTLLNGQRVHPPACVNVCTLLLASPAQARVSLPCFLANALRRGGEGGGEGDRGPERGGRWQRGRRLGRRRLRTGRARRARATI
jgi:hypothetical protein